ncbi:MAG: SGNH/GDSL hydrolase family protein [Jatrophihabitans sp.]|uniref:SGNH/GDSL hydrolase family protein n=1 Tax=Jatrophihabitans sp. TaxID=1932789 RepID=UPI003F810923
MEPALDYANVTGRPSGPFVRLAAALLPGVARVQREHAPWAAAWHAANRRALTVPGRRWIVLGDSMSQGIGAPRFDAGWVDSARRRLGPAADGLVVVNLSASGARVPDVLDQQLPAWSALPPAPEGPHGADVVTVFIGANDLMRRAHRDALPGAFTELLRRLPVGAIVATMPQPRAAARSVNARLETAAADGRVRLVDLRTGGPRSWRGKLASDHFHPNEAGYAELAEAFVPALRTALAEDTTDGAAKSNDRRSSGTSGT